MTSAAAAAAPLTLMEPGAFSITVARSALSDALKKLTALVPTGKVALPILACARIDVTDRKAVLSVTDIDSTIALVLPVQSEGIGSVALPVRRLAEIVANLPTSSVITLAVSGRRAKVQAGRAKFDVLGMDPAEFPDAAPVESAASATVPARAFVSAISRAALLACVDANARPVLNSVYVERAEHGRLVAVGADNPQLARILIAEDGEASASDAEPAALAHLIPRAVVQTIKTLFGGEPADATLVLTADENRALLTGKTATLQFRMTAGPYVRYTPLLASAPVVSCTLSALELSIAVRRARVVGESTDRVEFHLSAERPGELVVRATSEDAGAAEDIVSIRDVDLSGTLAGEFSIGLAGAKVLTALETLDTDALRLEFNGSGKAVFFFPAEDLTPARDLALLMPLRDLNSL